MVSISFSLKLLYFASINFRQFWKLMFKSKYVQLSLRKKCPYSELLWSAFSRIRTEYGEIPEISLRIQSKCGKMFSPSLTLHFKSVARIHRSARIFFSSNDRRPNFLILANKVFNANLGELFTFGGLPWVFVRGGVKLPVLFKKNYVRNPKFIM